MPDTRDFQSNALSSYSNVSPVNHNIDESMRRLKVEDNYVEVDAYANPYPDRPGEPNCIYYMKTGSCAYGSTCRYNHPNFVVQGNLARPELPERVGQPDCQYFLRTGMCKYGATCKYHHPRDRHDARTLGFNIFGFPMRQDEKSCSYYMRTGTCKFGVACKFDHPQPAGAVYPLTGSPAYGSALSSVVQTPGMPFTGEISAWPLSNGLPYMSSSRMQCLPAYMPVIIPPTPGTMPGQQGWTNYTGDVNQVPAADVLGHTQTPKFKNNAHPSPSHVENFPERPDQPDCQYYLKTGSCRYGSTCKYHHPKERISSTPSILGPLGLPLRPGHPVCSFYSTNGTCRFGSACRFDHPLISYYNYTLPEVFAPDQFPPFPNQRNPPAATLTAPTKIMKAADGVRDEAPPSDGDEFRRNNPPAQTASPSHTARSSESLPNQSD